MSHEDRDFLMETLGALYGDGAWEVSKALSEKDKRTQARVGLASNVLGLAAGVVGTKDAAQKLLEIRNTKKNGAYVARHAKAPKKLGKYAVPLAAGALGLQVANNAGDVVANRVLSRESKKKVSKEHTGPTNAKLKLVKRGVNTAGEGAKAAPKLTAKIAAAAQEVPDNNQMPVKIFNRKTVKKSVGLEIKGEVSKMLTDKKQVFGWASVIELDGEPVVDLQGDVMTIDTIEKAAYDYVHTSRKGGRQHARDGELPLHVSDMIESFVMTPEKKEAMGLGPEVPTGWWVGFQVNDEDTWQAYKDGKLKEFSIHGSGTRKALEV